MFDRRAAAASQSFRVLQILRFFSRARARTRAHINARKLGLSVRLAAAEKNCYFFSKKTVDKKNGLCYNKDGQGRTAPLITNKFLKGIESE